MFCRCYVAEERSAGCSGDCASDRRGYMIISRSNVCYKRSEHVERSTMAQCFLDFHICCNLVHRHMARAFDHYLNVFLPCTFCQFSKRDQFFNLCSVCSICNTAGTACITETHSNVIFLTDIENFIIMLIERIFLSGHFHPGEHDRSTAGNDIHKTFVLLKAGSSSTIHSAVNGHKVHTVFCVHAHDVQPFFRSDLAEGFMIINDSVVNRHSSDHSRTGFCQFAAESTGIAVGTEIHDCFGTHINCRTDFLIFHIHIFPVAGYAQIYIDLGGQLGSDTART